jgi:hypothetical protein
VSRYVLSQDERRLARHRYGFVDPKRIGECPLGTAFLPWSGMFGDMRFVQYRPPHHSVFGRRNHPPGATLLSAAGIGR